MLRKSLITVIIIPGKEPYSAKQPRLSFNNKNKKKKLSVFLSSSACFIRPSLPGHRNNVHCFAVTNYNKKYY